MIFAQIKDNLIRNIIVLDNLSLIDQFTEGFDSIEQIDSISPEPQIGWTWDGSNFSPPEETEE